jgi:hypothetical protein
VPGLSGGGGRPSAKVPRTATVCALVLLNPRAPPFSKPSRSQRRLDSLAASIMPRPPLVPPALPAPYPTAGQAMLLRRSLPDRSRKRHKQFGSDHQSPRRASGSEDLPASDKEVDGPEKEARRTTPREYAKGIGRQHERHPVRRDGSGEARTPPRRPMTAQRRVVCVGHGFVGTCAIVAYTT